MTDRTTDRTSDRTAGRPHCFFVPPHVQREVAKNADGPAAEKKQLELADASRKNRATAITKVDAGLGAAPALAPAPTGTSRREVYDLQHGTTQRVNLVRAEGRPETDDVDVTNAYDNAGLVRRFLTTVFERESIDNRALDLVLNVHFATSYNNAFWDGDEMTFGDGDGVIFSGFARSLDVVAHELGHGVTQFTAGLVYKNEPGALNEHFSDVFGTTVTQWANGETPVTADWLIGDEIMGPQLYGEALRSMRAPGTAYDNPVLGKDPQPAHYADRYTGTADYGGVHINSGIPNRAFYLAAVDLGDTVTAARIWYHALQFLSPTASFVQAAQQVATSARVLVKAGRAPKGAAQVVRAAWRSVGVQ